MDFKEQYGSRCYHYYNHHDRTQFHSGMMTEKCSTVSLSNIFILELTTYPKRGNNMSNQSHFSFQGSFYTQNKIFYLLKKLKQVIGETGNFHFHNFTFQSAFSTNTTTWQFTKLRFRAFFFLSVPSCSNQKDVPSHKNMKLIHPE